MACAGMERGYVTRRVTLFAFHAAGLRRRGALLRRLSGRGVRGLPGSGNRRCPADGRVAAPAVIASQPRCAQRRAAKGDLQDGRESLLAFHGEHHALDQLFGRRLPRLRAFGLAHIVGHVLAIGVAKRVEPACERAFLLQQLCQLRRHGRFALFEIRLEGELRHLSCIGVRAFLHGLVHQNDVAFFRRAEE